MILPRWSFIQNDPSIKVLHNVKRYAKTDARAKEVLVESKLAKKR